ncbi:His Kinase A (phospho-acceptor) domain-containing protein [Tenacibaculum sp. MAR_2009_124]|uniref:sensor histidine kinase n=1 Tax=Tenacibaculum sp. MAR_2009_124 TaxID=1250059 RepID=UPI00089769FE|nr:HAMP domain-containing sensor histidine kinase [Tenacibaculum sp. MAR_2009_124]SEC81815.1 His Kinase A (phospho-acceptor) domain-containing protein [Tenacibaculum sp. MAR_2009_124]
MSFFYNNFWLKRIAVFASFIIVLLILWNTYIFFQKFKEEERMKMELYASANQELNNSDLDTDITLLMKIIDNNKNIPAILTDSNGDILSSNNLDSIKSLDSLYLKNQLTLMKSQNKPIEVSYKNTQKRYVYYRNSDLLYKLKYYPLALLLILALFLTIIYMVFKSNKIAEQNKLWTGMAKETAHQIGTPLSSLLGWIEILRAEEVNEMYVEEIEKDVDRLNIIANRFSKIGSLPSLKEQNIVCETKQVFTYLESRSSKQVHFIFNAPNSAIVSQISVELFGWVIENLIKNAIDAMSGKGEIKVSVNETSRNVIIRVSDTGKGIPKSQFSNVFKPGFTTKKRGWGLGLSLSKRIVESYHKGRIFVQKSELGKGTTFEIQLNKV